MKGLTILLLIVAGVFIAGPLQADIYEWTDKKGIKHFTNYKPPDDTVILTKSEEVPYDEAADLARIEADTQYQLELARMELAAREAELEQREAEAKRKIAEAQRYADDTVRAADEYLDDTVYDRWYYRSGGYWGGGYRHSRDKRSYYRNRTTSIYWKDRSRIDHYRHSYPKKANIVTGKNITAGHTATKSIPIRAVTGHRNTCGPPVNPPAVPIASIPEAEAPWAGVI